MGDGLSKNRIKGLSASIDQNSAVLILGTLPGRMSLTYGQYYADPSNKFWDILFIACGEKIDKTDQGKKRLLEKYHIALWDILASAVRKTSNDKDISDETPNDLPLLLSQYPNIKLLVFHSNDAYKCFKRFFKNTAVPYICVSSPSGQNRKGTQEKAKEWRAALSCAIPQLRIGPRLAWKGALPCDIIFSQERSIDMEIEKIRNYISYFETVNAETACRWEESRKLESGAFSMPFPVYDTHFLNFIDDVSNSDLMDVSYGDTLEEYGLGMNNELTKKIDTADLRLAKAILTCYVRQERFCDGLWGRAIKEGTFLALLKRIDTLLTL